MQDDEVEEDDDDETGSQSSQLQPRRLFPPEERRKQQRQRQQQQHHQSSGKCTTIAHASFGASAFYSEIHESLEFGGIPIWQANQYTSKRSFWLLNGNSAKLN